MATIVGGGGRRRRRWRRRSGRDGEAATGGDAPTGRRHTQVAAGGPGWHDGGELAGGDDGEACSGGGHMLGYIRRESRATAVAVDTSEAWSYTITAMAATPSCYVLWQAV